ncbi:MAG: P-II family nitrogen regulator [Methanobrevibacter sp.]|jgi:nitrogen regulatory protein PII 2|nr:P-II family nitrogen regulator [Candidatus Methanovirga basalitermitum]
MKEIMAIIRPSMVNKTKEVLNVLGHPGLTAVSVFGRGKQKSILSEVKDVKDNLELQEQSRQMTYVPKRLLSITVPDEDVNLIVEAIMKVNHTGNIGDGKIFVLPVEDSIRVRNKDRGLKAII